MKALFLDRDGVVNREVGYLVRAEDVEWVPGLWELCAAARDAGYLLIVVTNQSGIARGLYSEADFHALMEWMQREFQAHGVEMAGYYFCAHHPVHGVGEYKLDTDCRKPAPGMILRAAEEHGLDISRSVLVGDRCTDIAAGTAAGIPHLFLFGNTEAGPCDGSYRKIDSLAEVETTLQSLSA